MMRAASQLADVYMRQGHYQAAQRQLESLFGMRRPRVEAFLGYGHEVIVTCRTLLSEAYHKQGRKEDAEKLMLTVLERAKRRYGKDADETTYTSTSLAQMYEEQQRWPEAEQLISRIFERAKKDVGETHMGTLAIMAKLAEAQLHQGRAKGLTLIRECHRLALENYGPDHEVTVEAGRIKKYWEKVCAGEGEDQGARDVVQVDGVEGAEEER